MVGETLQQGAPGSRSEPKISVHSLKGRFEVTSVEARSPGTLMAERSDRHDLAIGLLEKARQHKPNDPRLRIYTLRGFESVLAGSVQVSTGTKTSLSFQDGTSIHASSSPRRPGCAPRISGLYARHDDLTTNLAWRTRSPSSGSRGRAPGQQPFEILEDLVGYVATELNANPRDLDLYARRGPTLSAHLEGVREHLGLTAFDEKARRRLAPFVFKEG